MGQALLALVVGLALLPVDGRTQHAAKVPRIGVLQWEGCPGPNSVFGRALSDLGYTWGEKIEVVCRSAEGNYQGLSNAAADLVAQKVDVIVGLSHVAAHAAHRATQVHSYRHDRQWRSGEDKSGRQPGASRRELDGSDLLFDGAGRETAAAAQGNGSGHHARRRFGQHRIRPRVRHVLGRRGSRGAHPRPGADRGGCARTSSS